MKWEVTDKYGYPLSLSAIRDGRINEVFGDTSLDELGQKAEIRYGLSLRKKDEDGFGMYGLDFNLDKSLLSLYSMSDRESSELLRISLPCYRLEDCDYLIDLICRGNNMHVGEWYIIKK